MFKIVIIVITIVSPRAAAARRGRQTSGRRGAISGSLMKVFVFVLLSVYVLVCYACLFIAYYYYVVCIV